MEGLKSCNIFWGRTLLNYFSLEQVLNLNTKTNKKNTQMGNQQNNDSRVRLYLTTFKPLIYAGQYLQATAHADVL